MTACSRLRRRWLAAEKQAHKTMHAGKMRAHKLAEHASERIYEQAADKGCKWAK